MSLTGDGLGQERRESKVMDIVSRQKEQLKQLEIRLEPFLGPDPKADEAKTLEAVPPGSSPLVAALERNGLALGRILGRLQE